MALATKCPHCTTIFRVAHDQLKLRGGIVRCGACNEVFDGNAALVEPALKQPVIIDLPPPPTAAPATSPELDALITTLDARHGGLPAAEARPAAAPETAAPASGPEPAWQPAREAMHEPAREALAAEPPAGHDEERHPPLPQAGLDTGPDTVPDAELDLALDVAEASTGAAIWPEPGQEEADIGPVLPAIPTLSNNPPALADGTPADEPFDLDFNVDVDDGAAGVHAPPPWEEKRNPLTEIRNALPGTRGAEIEALLLELDHGLEAAQQQERHALQEQAPADAWQEQPFIPLQDGAAEPARAAYPPLSALDDEDRQDDSAAPPAAEDEAADEHLTALALHDSFELDAYPPRAGRDDAGDGARPADSAGDDDDDDEDRVTLSHAATAGQASGEPAPQGDDDSDRMASAAVAAAATAAAAAATGPATPLSSGEAGGADGEEPGFVKRARRRKQLRKAGRIAMAAGIPLLLAALAAQVLGTFRNPLAAAVPALKPALVSACALAGCKVELPAQIDALSIEQGELQTLADNLFSFGTTLRNGSRSAQAWPHIELILNDAADKPVLRRVFAPREYLAGAAGQAGSPAAPADSAKGFAPRSEQSVKLYFELAHVKASGYHIAVFYP